MKKFLAMMLMLSMTLSVFAFASADEVALRLWVGDSQDSEWINAVIENFKAANPDKTYNFTINNVNEPDVSKQLRADPASGADVFVFPDDQFNDLHRDGILAQVMKNADAVIEANGGAESKTVQAAMDDGKLFAYPLNASNGYFMFYNKEYFTKEDVESLDVMMEKAAAAGKLVGYPMSNGWFNYSFFRGAGLEMKLGEDGKTNVCNWNATDTEITGVQVLEAMLAIASNKGFKNADSEPFVAGVKDGSIIAGVSGTWNAKVAEDTWGENYAATKLPTYTVAGKQAQMASFAGYKMVGVNAYSEMAGDAMDFAEFMTNEQSQELRFKIRGDGPSNVKVAASEAVQSSPAVTALLAQSPYADVQRVGSKYWDPAATLGGIIVDGNSNNEDLQKLLDVTVEGITAVAD